MNDENELTVERIVKMETQMAYVLVEQSNLRTILDKHNQLLEALAKQTNAQDYQTRAVIDRTEQHAKEIERLQSGQVDVGKILEAMRVQISILKYVGGVVATLVIGYLFSLFVK